MRAARGNRQECEGNRDFQEKAMFPGCQACMPPVHPTGSRPIELGTRVWLDLGYSSSQKMFRKLAFRCIKTDETCESCVTFPLPTLYLSAQCSENGLFSSLMTDMENVFSCVLSLWFKFDSSLFKNAVRIYISEPFDEAHAWTRLTQRRNHGTIYLWVKQARKNAFCE